MVQPAAQNSHDFSHGKGRQNRPDSQPLQMPEKEERHSGGNGQAGHIKGYFDSRIADADNLSELPWKKVRWDNGQAAPV